MSPAYILTLLAIGTLLIGLCRMLFGWTSMQIASADALRDEIASSTPDFRMADYAIAIDRSTALAQDATTGSLHLAAGRGDVLVTRRLGRKLVRVVAREGNVLNLRLADFTLPSVRVALCDEASARIWEARVSAIRN